MKYLLLLCALAVISHSSAAADANGKFAMKGAGLLPCSVYMTEREAKSKAYFLISGWVEGYVSAHNKLLPDTFDLTTFEWSEMLLKIMENHCKNNADDLLHGVVDSMIIQLQPNRLVAEDKKLLVTQGEKHTYLYTATLERMQQALAKRSLYQGDINGRFTDDTRAALFAFQSDIGFIPTGYPDQATLWRLLQ